MDESDIKVMFSKHNRLLTGSVQNNLNQVTATQRMSVNVYLTCRL